MKKLNKSMINEIEKRMNESQTITGNAFGEIFSIDVKTNIVNKDINSCVKDIVACIEYRRERIDSSIGKTNYFDIFTICVIKNFTNVWYDENKDINGVFEDILRSVMCMENAVMDNGNNMLHEITTIFLNNGHHNAINKRIEEEKNLTDEILKTLGTK